MCRGQDVTLNDLKERRTSGGVPFGDFGTSWVLLRDRPVSLLIEIAVALHVAVDGHLAAVSIIIGVPYRRVFRRAPILQVRLRRHRPRFLRFVHADLFFALLMILVFSLIFKDIGWFWLPTGNAESVRDFVIPLLGNVVAGSLLDKALHMIMPMTVLIMVNVAGWVRFIRGSMLEVLRQDV